MTDGPYLGYKLVLFYFLLPIYLFIYLFIYLLIYLFEIIEPFVRNQDS